MKLKNSYPKIVSKSIHKNEKQFLAAVDRMADSFVILETQRDKSREIIDFLIIYINNSGARHLNLDRQKIIGKKITAILPNFNKSEIFHKFKQVVETGRPLNFEAAVNEITRTQPLKGTFDLNVASYPKGLAVNWRNISSRAQTEQAAYEHDELRRREASLRLFFDHVPAALAMLDKKMCYLNVSKRWLDDYGLTEKDIIGKCHYDIFPEIPDKWKEIHRKGLAGEMIHAEEDSFLRADGTVQWLKWDVIPWRDLNGEVAGLVIFSEDITKRKIAEENLKQSEKRFKKAEQLAHVASWIINVKTGIFEVSEEFNRILGRPIDKKEMTMEEYFEYIHPDDFQYVTSILKNLQEKNGQNEMEYRLRLPDGSVKYIYGISEPEFQQNQEVIRRFGAAMDITYMKNQQQNLENALNELERSNKDLEQFAYVVSHDLKEPVRMVSSYMKLLSKKYKDQLDEDAQTYINFAADGAKRMNGLIEDLLIYSRVSTQPKEYTRVDLNQIMNEVLLDLKIKIEENQAEISTGSLPVVNGDDVQLRQLFQNLISNAIKFRSGQKPLVSISAEERKKDWLFKVSDNGIGIKPDDFEKIFVIFKRLNNQDQYEGTGIGLAICKKIVERHGGTIWLESQPGQGTTFLFTLNKKY